MTIGSVVLGVLITGAILGVAAIGSVVLNYLRHQKVGQGGALMMLAGIVLLGLSAWQSFELTAGKITLKANSILKSVEEARAVIKTSVVSATSPNGCEEERERLRADLEVEKYKQKQLEEILKNIEKELTMTPITNLR